MTADILDFPIPLDPQLAELAFATLSYMQEQTLLNEAIRDALQALGQRMALLEMAHGMRP